MPFESQAQERWMFANKPEMAARWAKETPKSKKLPVKKSIPVWEKPDPTKSEKHLSQKKENKARARARSAGRPYPNLVDNMAVSKFETPAWTRSEGKNPNGGLNAKGRASAKAQGHNLKPPVKSGNNPRRASFLARMGNMPGPEHKPNGEPTRLLLSLQAWGASSKADAKRKAANMSVSKSLPNSDIHQGKFIKALVPVNPVRLPAGTAPNNPLKLKTTGRVSGHMNMTGINRPKTPGTYVAKGYDFTMTQSRFGGASAVGKAYSEPVSEERAKQKTKRRNAVGIVTVPAGVVLGAHGGRLAYAGHKVSQMRGSNVERAVGRTLGPYLKGKGLLYGLGGAGLASVGLAERNLAKKGKHPRFKNQDIEKGLMNTPGVIGRHAFQQSTKNMDSAARAASRREAERAFALANKGTHGDLVVRPRGGSLVPTRSAKPAASKGPGSELIVRPKGEMVSTRKPKPASKPAGQTSAPRFYQTTPLREIGGRKSVDLGMPGMRVSESAPKVKQAKAKKPKVKDNFTTRSYAPEAALAAGAGGALGYSGYKSVNKAVDEYGNPVKTGPSASTAAMAGGAITAGLGAKKFGDARFAPVKLTAENRQAKRNAQFTASNYGAARANLVAARANKTRLKGGQAVKRAESNLRVAQNKMDISASQAQRAKAATKNIGLAQRQLRWKGAGLLASGAGLAGIGTAMKEKNQ